MKTKSRKQRIAELTEVNRHLVVMLETVIRLAENNRPHSELDDVLTQLGGHPFDYVLNMARDEVAKAKGLK